MAKKVLVVDDDQTTVRFLMAALEDNGYEPVGAYDGVEGFEMVEQESPDLILLDVMMPRRTGFDFFRKLKADDRLREIPVIMISGVSTCS